MTDKPGISVDLASADLLELTLPQDARNGQPPPDRIPVGPWDAVDERSTSWTAASPIRPRTLFFHDAPGGTRLLDPAADPVKYKNKPGTDPTWTMDARQIRLSQPSGKRPGSHTLHSKLSAARERRLNLQWSGLSPVEFARANILNGQDSVRGLLLPAPSSATIEVALPASAEIHFQPGIALPEVADLAPSDGAKATLSLEVDGTSVELWSAKLTAGRFEDVRLDLSAWSGRTVRLRLSADPLDNSVNDYVMWGSPQVYSRAKRAKRVVLVMVDTLRQDHLGVYGYDRATSPSIDAWAKGAAVYSQARTVAPWTLPSYRATLIGDQPNFWFDRKPLPQLLAERGWATHMVAGNMYLASNFDSHRGFNEHHVQNWPSATDQVRSALSWLDKHDGQDAMVLVHLMDPHLPYQEPDAFRRKFAGDATPALGETFVRAAVARKQLSEADKRYVVDRYDNNVAFVDHALGELFARVGDDALVVLFSDHGEEFWEHDGFEHGHSLYDEVLRVPLILRGPAIAPGTIDQPVTLMDVTPTVLDHLSITAEQSFRGTSLLRTVPSQRLMGLGYPLYGPERWGVLQGTSKYQASRGVESLYELDTDPGEQSDVWPGTASAAAWRDRLGEAHGRGVAVGWRVAWVPKRRRHLVKPVEVMITSAPGSHTTWLGANPTGHASGVLTEHPGRTHVRWRAGRLGRSVLVAANQPGVASPTLRVRRGKGEWEDLPLDELRTEPDGDGRPVGVHTWDDGASVQVTLSVGPGPLPAHQQVLGYDAELNSMLRAGGYAVGEP